MALKQMSYPLQADLQGEDPALVAPGMLEPLVRRIAGDGPVNLLRAKAEVDAVLWASAGALPDSAAPADALPPAAIPSVAAGAREDRLLAEIDQDGFAFARDPADAPFFNRRARRAHRQQNLIDIALVDGRVCIRKRVRGLRLGARLWGDRRVSARTWMHRGLWASLGLYLYSEAAALLRLRDLPFVPRLRRIDFAERALYIDYVQGENLRNQAARGGAAVHDQDLRLDPGLSNLSAHDLERREVQLLDRAGGGDFRREISEMAREINARGVAPLDVKLGNFIRGGRTGRLYWIDFEISRLQSQPRWEADLAAHRLLLEELFDLAAHGPALP
ncbi:MAG: hypothetical protein ACXWLR_03375 [Myxococcales bacterium]